MGNFELENWYEINQNGGTIGTGINHAIHKLTVAIFNSGSKTSTALNYTKSALEKASDSSDKHADALIRATWILAIATDILALATIALVIVTFVRRG